ncbi:MAG: aspartate carbamoyltransferase, partial [Gammaproteobacteria bacterium]|nr:aspartate carbamoyltransferase [Gammaproteobacteria bacterium]
RDLNIKGREGAVSYYEQVTTFGNTYITRNIVLAINIAALAVIYLMPSVSVFALAVWLVVAVSVLLSAVVSRALFYVLVVPTTMPGAFFWRNKGFEAHARESGLANMPQVGVIPDVH